VRVAVYPRGASERPGLRVLEPGVLLEPAFVRKHAKELNLGEEMT
jgi:hypothetical protein